MQESVGMEAQVTTAEDAEDMKVVQREMRHQTRMEWLCGVGIHWPNNYVMRISEMREGFLWKIGKAPRSCACGRRWWWPKGGEQ